MRPARAYATKVAVSAATLARHARDKAIGSGGALLPFPATAPISAVRFCGVAYASTVAIPAVGSVDGGNEHGRGTVAKSVSDADAVTAALAIGVDTNSVISDDLARDEFEAPRLSRILLLEAVSTLQCSSAALLPEGAPGQPRIATLQRSAGNAALMQAPDEPERAAAALAHAALLAGPAALLDTIGARPLDGAERLRSM